MSRREVVGVFVLGLAVLVSMGFFIAKGSSGGADLPVRPVPTIAVPTPTPTYRNSTTPVIGGQAPPAPIGGWRLAFLSYAENNIPLPLDFSSAPTLDLAYEAPPFADLPSNAWGVEATGLINMPPGPAYAFTIQHTGQVQVFIDNVEVADQGGASLPLHLRVDLKGKAGGATTIRIVARSTGAPFVLKYTPPDPYVPE